MSDCCERCLRNDVSLTEYQCAECLFEADFNPDEHELADMLCDNAVVLCDRCVHVIVLEAQRAKTISKL